MHRVLVVEDDPAIAEALRVLLERSGFDPLVAHAGPTGWQALVETQPDALLLDLSLPGLSGAQLLRRLRDEGADLVVIAVTADSSADSIVRVLELGADDYVVKPYRGPELVARLRAALRRIAPRPYTAPSAMAPLVRGSLVLDRERCEVRLDGQLVRLSRTERRFLECLLERPNTIVAREEVLRRVWGEHGYLDRSTPRVTLRRLRRKLDAAGRAWGQIRSVPGVGWGFFEA